MSDQLSRLNIRTIAVCCSIVASAFGLPSNASAQFSWESRELEFRASVTDVVIQGEFKFTNTGDRKTTISEVKTSCGCTTAELAKKTYEPGEKGSIKAIFAVGERVGLQRKHIILRTDSPDESLTQLTLTVTIPELLKIEPRLVRWDYGEAPVTRNVELSTGTEQAVRILGVETSDDRFIAKLTTVEEGKRYRIAVAPSHTNQPMRALFRVATDFPVEMPKVFIVPIEISWPPADSTIGSGASAANVGQASDDQEIVVPPGRR